MTRASEPTVDAVTLPCRFCSAKNRIPVSRALEDLTLVRCGKCGSGLLRVQGEPLTDLSDDALAHPWDREALDKLKAIPLADTVIQKVLGSTLDKLQHFDLMAGGVRVGPQQAPRLWRLYLEAAGRIGVDPPPLFITQHPLANAFTVGAGQPQVGVTTGLLDLLDDRAILGVLGHELTHVRLGHVTYRTLVLLILRGALKLLDVFGLASLVVKPLQVALFRWYQMSELSADRGELLTTGSLETFVRTHMLLAGGSQRWASDLNVAAFVDQAHEAERLRDNDLLLWAMELFNANDRTHPLTVWRVHHGLKWAQTPAFFELLAGTPPDGLLGQEG